MIPKLALLCLQSRDVEDASDYEELINQLEVSSIGSDASTASLARHINNLPTPPPELNVPLMMSVSCSDATPERRG
jgi:hypothetical protein